MTQRDMPPQPIIDALTVLQAKADAVNTAVTAKSQTAVNLTTAQTADTQAGAVLTQADQDEATQLAIVQALLQQYYGAAPTPPAPGTPAPTPPAITRSYCRNPR